MYHQFDRTLHPRQSVFNIIMNMNEQNKQLEKDIKDLESVSILKHLVWYIWNISLFPYLCSQCKSVYIEIWVPVVASKSDLLYLERLVQIAFSEF